MSRSLEPGRGLSVNKQTVEKTNLDIKFAQLSQTLSLSWRTMAEDNGDVKDFKFLPPCGNLYVLLGIF